MVATIDELSIEYIEDGVVTIKQLDKIILTKGAWCTIIYRIQTWNRSTKSYNPVSYSIHRYQKRHGEYQQRSKFNISSRDQAEKIVNALANWLKKSDTAVGKR